MEPTPYVASLRIYEPLESFPKADQLRWLKNFGEINSRDLEQTRALTRTIVSYQPLDLSDGAHVLAIDGRKFLSPWSTAMRCWIAIQDFKSTLPSNVATFFIPKDVEESFSSKSDLLDSKVPHILSETWVIPPRWFALFEPEERLRGRKEGAPFTVIRTKMSLAKQRCITAHAAVRGAFGPGPVEEELVQLLNWLNIFNPESIVELDYGGLATYLDQALRANGEDGIDADTSIEDVTTSISGLKSGDGAMAGRGYERLMSRWRNVAAFQQAT